MKSKVKYIKMSLVAATALVLSFLQQVNAQNTTRTLNINYKNSVLESSKKEKSMEFTVSDIKNDADLERLKKAASFYPSTFSFRVISHDAKAQTAVCELTFVGEVNFPIVKRFLVGADIAKVNAAGKTMSREEFFQILK